MSLRDSGTKKGKKIRVLAASLLMILLAVTLCSVMVSAAEESPDVVSEVSEMSNESSDASDDASEQSDSAKFKSGFDKLPENASVSERLMYGLKVAGIGMSVVFLVLIIIMAILYVFKLFATTGKKPASAPAAPVTAAPAAVTGTDEETIVAVATAAIAASRGASACAFKVISITKIQ